MDTPRRPETGRPRAAQFAPPGGVHTGWKRDRVREEGDACGTGGSPPDPPAPAPRPPPPPAADAVAQAAAAGRRGREARDGQAEAVAGAFAPALQGLPPRQVAVLILRDVLGYRAGGVAGMLDSTVESVTSALKRARASLQHRLPPAAGHQPPPALGSPAEQAIVAKFVRAWESADLDALVALLADDVFVSMPPMPFEYQGRDVVARFCAILFGAGRR